MSLGAVFFSSNELYVQGVFLSDYIVNPVKKVSEFPKGPALTDTYRRKESDAKDTDTKVDNRKMIRTQFASIAIVKLLIYKVQTP